MSLALNPFRPIAHASLMRGAPALLLGASRLSQTIFHARIQQRFSTVVQRAAPKAVNLPRKSLVHQVRPWSRISEQRYQYRTRQRLRSALWRDLSSVLWQGFCQGFCCSLLTQLCMEFYERFVKTISGSHRKHRLTLRSQVRGFRNRQSKR
jgi:hypothetical protein